MSRMIGRTKPKNKARERVLAKYPQATCKMVKSFPAKYEVSCGADMVGYGNNANQAWREAYKQFC